MPTGGATNTPSAPVSLRGPRGREATNGCACAAAGDPIGWCSFHGCYVDRCPTVTHYISLWQPWASLLVGGEKRIETRGWPTKFRGRLAVHAGKRLDLDTCYEPRTSMALSRLGIHRPSALPTGGVLGWVTIADCLKMTASCSAALFPDGSVERNYLALDRDARLTDDERAFGNYAPRRYGWMTGTERRVLENPIPMRALQRIQKLPPDVARAVSW